jgi:KUP system potassium uptake protein
VDYLFTHGVAGFLVLGGVFLCVTGAEALYADMGHFGRKPIWVSWFVIVFPSLLLNYAGQAAIVIEGASTGKSIFYSLCPHQLLIPMVILATVATIIASQSIITGAFSMTRQAILLGWMPRLLIKQTSKLGYGQIYVGVVNFLLMIFTIGLTIGFGKAEHLAAAYGIAVSLTMMMTTVLLFIAMRHIWQWNIIVAGSVAGIFLIIDSAFVLANLSKVAEGGYIPLLLAIVVYTVMRVWNRGATTVNEQIHESLLPITTFMEKIKSQRIPRVSGTGVFLTRSKEGIPPVMVWHVKHNRALHEQLFVLRVVVMKVPHVPLSERMSIQELSPQFWRAEARYGFMERPDIPLLLKSCESYGCPLHIYDLVYYVGHDTIIGREDDLGMPPWQQRLYAMMARNATHVSDFFSLPGDAVVEIGRQFWI